MSPSARIGVLVVLSVVVCACRSAPPARVRTSDGTVREQRVDGGARASLARAANEIPCSPAEMSVELLGAGGYRVEGCGSRMTYTCIFRAAGLGGHVLCELNMREQSERTARTASRGGTGTATAVTWTDTDLRGLLERLEPGVGGCLAEGTDSIELRIAVSPSGVVRRSPGQAVREDVGRCIDAQLSIAGMPRRVVEGRSVVMRFTRRAHHADEAPFVEPVAPPAGATTTTPPAVAQTVEARARAEIDARAPAILACVEAPALSMQVSWAADGRLDALLRGARQGTPEEECVRAIVGQLSIPAPGSAGTIVHAVQHP